MTTYTKIKTEIEKLEASEFAHLKKCLPICPVTSMTNGEVQFFSTEDIYEGAPNNINRLVIAGVGINFGQDTNLFSYPTAHIHGITSRKTWVEDYENPEMRCVLDVALRQYFKNSSDWFNKGYASSSKLAMPLRDGDPRNYILIATNVCPLLSQISWTSHLPADCTATLAAWNPNQHLCNLIHALGSDIDLWVVHGIDEVWPLFLKTGGIKKWIMTPNLSCRNLSNKSIKKFWKKPRHITARLPQWPVCPIFRFNHTESSSNDFKRP